VADLPTKTVSIYDTDIDQAEEEPIHTLATQDLVAALTEPTMQSLRIDSSPLGSISSTPKIKPVETEPEIKLSGPRIKAWPITAELMGTIIEVTKAWDVPATMGELIDDCNYKWLKAMVTIYDHRIDVDASHAIRARIGITLASDGGPAAYAKELSSSDLTDRATTLGRFDYYLATISELSSTMRKINGACIGAFVAAAEDNVDDRGFLDDTSKRYIKAHIDPSIDMTKGISNTIHKRFQRFGRLHQIQETFGEIIFCDPTLRVNLEEPSDTEFDRLCDILDALGTTKIWMDASATLGTGEAINSWKLTLISLTTPEALGKLFPTRQISGSQRRLNNKRPISSRTRRATRLERNSAIASTSHDAESKSDKEVSLGFDVGI